MQEVRRIAENYEATNKYDTVRSLLAAIETFQALGYDEQQVKEATVMTIQNLALEQPNIVNKIKEIFEPKYQQIAVKVQAWMPAKDFKLQEVSSKASVYNEHHYALSSRLSQGKMTDEELETTKELIKKFLRILYCPAFLSMLS